MSDTIQFSEPFETILKLLAITVLIDEKERDRELVEFCFCAALHNQRLHPDKILCPDSLRAWYDSKKSYLASKLRDDNSEQFLRDTLRSIDDKGVQRQVLISIFDISVADYDLADVETNFIKLALEVWDTPMPDPSEVKVYA